MKPVELYAQVRHACHVEGLSQREASRRFGIDPKTVAKMLRHAVPPGYRRSKPPARPKLDGFTATIDQIVMADRSAPSKQRHTAKRIFERLRAEHGFAGSYTIVKDYLRERHARAQEMFVPLAHPPGHAQADFGEAVAVIGGVRQKIHFFCLDLPHSDACFVKAYPGAEVASTEVVENRRPGGWRARWSSDRRSRVALRATNPDLIGDPMTEDRLPLAELLAKADEGV